MRSISAEKERELHELWNLVLEKQSAARALLREHFFNDCLSRCYYSAFHAVTLLFALDDRAFASHKQTLGMFNKDYVRTKIFPEQVARDLEQLFESRQTGDYDYHVTFDETEAAAGLVKLESILQTIRAHVEEYFGISL